MPLLISQVLKGCEGSGIDFSLNFMKPKRNCNLWMIMVFGYCMCSIFEPEDVGDELLLKFSLLIIKMDKTNISSRDPQLILSCIFLLSPFLVLFFLAGCFSSCINAFFFSLKFHTLKQNYPFEFLLL